MFGIIRRRMGKPKADVILRRTYYPTGTLGVAEIAGEGDSIVMLERPWLDNKRGVSCIPEGVYDCAWLPRSASGKYTRVWHLQDVDDRDGILQHIGNKVAHSLGCQLTGSVAQVKPHIAVWQSGVALNKLREYFAEEDYKICIRQA